MEPAVKYSTLMLSTALAATALAATTFLGAGAASAADMPMKAAPYAAPVQIFSWTGCYIGVHAGAGVLRANNGEGSSGGNGTGGLAGGQVGCNYQQGNWVFGAEGEGYWSGIKSTNASSNSFEGINENRFADTAKNKSDFTIAARAGITFDRTLVYGKAGWAWGKFDFDATNDSICCSFNGGPFHSSDSASGTLNGLLLGVGIEHAITNNWTVKLEYNYLKYGSKELNVTSCNNSDAPTVTCFPTGTTTFSADKQIFKIGANYLFNMTP
jgi:outer membrane immunogenic protein